MPASDEIGKSGSRVTWVCDLNEKPARNAVCAVVCQPSVPLSANSRLRWMCASCFFGISRPSTLTHLTIALLAGWPAVQVMPDVARQLPLGAEAAQLTAMFMSSE